LQVAPRAVGGPRYHRPIEPPASTSIDPQFRVLTGFRPTDPPHVTDRLERVPTHEERLRDAAERDIADRGLPGHPEVA